MNTSGKILITGATGNIGKELTQYLSAKGASFRAISRKANIEILPGMELVSGDFDDPASLEKALEGVERAFLLTNSSEFAEAQQLRFVELAVKSGVRHIVKLSQWAADVHSPVRFLRYHAVVEQRIRESGVAFTFLRPNLFMQGLLGFRETIVGQGRFFGAVGDARISVVDTRDIAAAAGEALLQPQYPTGIYNLTGPEALTHYEMAEKLSSATGRAIQFVDVPAGTLREMLLQVGFPHWQADGLVEDYAHYARNEAAEVAFGVEQLTGRKPGSFDTFARDYARVFQ